MGHIVRIKAGGADRAFEGVNKLRTPLSGGGNCLWVPVSAVRRGAKSINKNGVYSPTDDGLYAYSQVTVNVDPEADSITGKGQDGNEYHIKKRGGGGGGGGSAALDVSKIPSSIAVTKPPTNLIYGEGAYLSFSGIEVTAYYNDGSVYGVIPFEELIFPIIQAPYDAADAYIDTTSDLQTNWEQPIRCYAKVVHFYDYHGFDGTTGQTYDTYMPSNGARMLIKKGQPGNVAVYFVSDSNGIIGKWVSKWFRSWVDGGAWHTDITDYYSVREYQHQGKTVYYASTGQVYSGSGADLSCEPIVQDVGNEPDKNTLWTAIYGQAESKGGFSVPVQWARHGDSRILETSYGITVVDI